MLEALLGEMCVFGRLDGQSGGDGRAACNAEPAFSNDAKRWTPSIFLNTTAFLHTRINMKKSFAARRVPRKVGQDDEDTASDVSSTNGKQT